MCDPDPPFDLYPFAPDRADVARRLRNFIDYWSVESFAGSPLADHADLWALVQRALADLKARIVAHI